MFGTYDIPVTTSRRTTRAPVLVTGPSIPVMSVEEAKAHLRFLVSYEDGLIAEFIETAIATVEKEAQIALLTQTWRLTLDQFPAWGIELRRPPVQSITSVVYLDENGDSTTAPGSLYRLDNQSRPSRLMPAYNQTWPSTYPVSNAVTVTFVCGETSRDNVSPIAKQAIRYLVAHYHKGREAVVTTGAQPIVVPLAYDDCISLLKWSGDV